MKGTLERYFDLAQRGTNVRTEVTAGVTTFLTMAYIAFVNPQILSDAGMPFDAVFVATCIAAALSTLLMGLYANYPIALAPGMGLNAFFAYGVVLGMGHTWQIALGTVFVSGVIFLVLSVLPVRRWIIEAIPQGQKLAIAAGIGLFLGIIALRNGGIIQGSEATLVTVGDLTAPAPILALARLLYDRGARVAPSAGRRHHRHAGRHRGWHHLRRVRMARRRIAATRSDPNAVCPRSGRRPAGWHGSQSS